MSYIDKEKTLEFVLNNTPHINGETTMECVERAIKEIPTADVVEVRHGTWYHGTTESGLLYAECSACGRKMNYTCYGYAYCALCGAKMDGERKEK